jgi:hypothetical protein
VFRRKLVEPAPLTLEELELATMDDQVRAQERLVKFLRGQYEAMSSFGKRTEEGIKLEVKLSTADAKWIKLQKDYQKKEQLYLKDHPKLPERTASYNLGQVACIVMLLFFIVCIFIR